MESCTFLSITIIMLRFRMNREWCDFAVYNDGEVVVDRILADLEYC